MTFRYTAIPEWPPLAWLARCAPGGAAVDVFHGPRVEITPDWYAEAIWAGEYAAGGFDHTDVVFGSGGRARDGVVTFVSSGTTVDRLQSLWHGGACWVSNSLVCLLAAANAVPDPTWGGYFSFFKSITQGIRRYQRELPTSAGPARLTYFDNLAWDGRELTEVSKAHPPRDFGTFDKYRGFLDSSLRLLSENLAARERAHPYCWLGTISSGYDSLTTAVLARPCGLQHVVSMTQARGGDPDSGEVPARLLGQDLVVISRDAWQSGHLPEVPFIASDAKGEDVFFRGAGPLLAGRALLTGFQGGVLWSTNAKGSGDIGRADQSGLSLTEYRLWVGFLHCPIAFLGVRQTPDVKALSRSAEMRPWNVGGRYNKPIARRIIESAGVPRGSFAVHKRAGSVLIFQRGSFLSAGSLADFRNWLIDHSAEWRSRGLGPPALQGGRTVRQRAAAVTAWALQTLAHATGGRLWPLDAAAHRLASIATWEPLFAHVFPWAMARAKERYGDGLKRLGLPRPEGGVRGIEDARPAASVQN